MIRCTVNGDLRQESSTSDMIFIVVEIISYVSRTCRLEPGDNRHGNTGRRRSQL